MQPCYLNRCKQENFFKNYFKKSIVFIKLLSNSQSVILSYDVSKDSVNWGDERLKVKSCLMKLIDLCKFYYRSCAQDSIQNNIKTK